MKRFCLINSNSIEFTIRKPKQPNCKNFEILSLIMENKWSMKPLWRWFTPKTIWNHESQNVNALQQLSWVMVILNMLTM